MDQKIRQLERVLSSYKARAQAALDALELEDWDGFESAMRWKKAAFHNFRAVDYLLERERPGYLQSEQWQALWQEIEGADQALADQIELQKSKLSQQLARIRNHKATLSKFQSGVKDKAGFQETV